MSEDSDKRSERTGKRSKRVRVPRSKRSVKGGYTVVRVSRSAPTRLVTSYPRTRLVTSYPHVITPMVSPMAVNVTSRGYDVTSHGDYDTNYNKIYQLSRMGGPDSLSNAIMAATLFKNVVIPNSSIYRMNTNYISLAHSLRNRLLLLANSSPTYSVYRPSVTDLTRNIDAFLNSSSTHSSKRSSGKRSGSDKKRSGSGKKRSGSSKKRSGSSKKRSGSGKKRSGSKRSSK